LIVVDASVIIEWILNTSRGQAIGIRLTDGVEQLQAPYLLDIEVLQVIRRYTLRNVISQTRGWQAIEDYNNLLLRRYPHTPLLARIWELKANLSAYDATYVALSEALNAPLLTCDLRLANAPGHHARVQVLKGDEV